MKFCHLLVTFVFLAIASSSFAEQPPKWGSIADVKHLANALYVTTFPIKQSELRTLLGMHDAHPLFGTNGDSPDTHFEIYGLTNPEDKSGYYAARIVFTSKLDGLDPDDFPVLDLQLLFISPSHLTFVLERGRYERACQNDIRVSTKKKGLSPRERADEMDRIDAIMDKESNETLAPTSASVTDHADAHSLPAAAATDR